jgi:hypothetical protein
MRVGSLRRRESINFRGAGLYWRIAYLGGLKKFCKIIPEDSINHTQ